MKTTPISDSIKHYRKLRNLTLQDLAEEIDVSISTISRWERGLNMPPAEQAGALAKALRVSVATIIEGRKIA